jgi:hypothetical protein
MGLTERRNLGGSSSSGKAWAMSVNRRLTFDHRGSAPSHYGGSAAANIGVEDRVQWAAAIARPDDPA